MWRKVILVLLMGIPYVDYPNDARADLVEFEFPCVVDYAIDRNSPEELLDQIGLPVIGDVTWAEAGTRGTVYFSYDTDAGAPNPNQPNLGFYYDAATLRLEFPTVTLITNDTLVSVQNDLTYWANDSTLYDAIEVEGYLPGDQVTFPPGTTIPRNIGITVRFLSTDLTTFSDGHLPAEIDLAKFDTKQFSVIGDNFEAGNPDSLTYEWLVSGSVVPEPGTACIFLCGLAGIGWMAVRKRKLINR